LLDLDAFPFQSVMQINFRTTLTIQGQYVTTAAVFPYHNLGLYINIREQIKSK